MALNNNKEIRIDKRRQLVASLLLRVPGITQRQVCDHLAGQSVVNPDTNKPYSLGTINNDIQRLRDEWRERAAEEVAERKARILAELDEMRRAAWGCGDLDVLLKIQKREADLLGLDAPQRQEVSGPGGKAIEIDDARAEYHSRALAALADALGGLLAERGDEGHGPVDAAEHAAVDGGAQSSR